MFKHKSNTLCNKILFSPSKITTMHPQMKRLYEAARIQSGISGQSQLARAMDASPQTVKNWETRGISQQGLIQAQRVFGCSASWLQTGKGLAQVADLKNEKSSVTLSNRNGRAYVSFDLLNVEAAAGSGTQAIEALEIVRQVTVLEEWARTALGSDLSRIKMITARGTSMQGTIENGDVLFVDATIRAFDGDGVYVIARGGDVQVKRLQRLHGDVLAIISDNRAYESERLAGDDANTVTICGRVLAAWNLRKLW